MLNAVRNYLSNLAGETQARVDAQAPPAVVTPPLDHPSRWLPRGWPGLTQATQPQGEWAPLEDFGKAPWSPVPDPEAVFLGEIDGRFLSITDDRHLVTIAGSRAGKGISLILPNLVTYTGSVLVIDPKGELARLTAEHRRDRLGQDVYILDPYDVSRSGGPSTYNPLAEIDLKGSTSVEDAAQIAEGLIEDQGGDSAYWVNAARNVVRALILCECSLQEDMATLTGMRGLLLALDRPRMITLMAETLEQRGFTTVSNYVSSLAFKPKDEFGSILSMAVEQTAFLDGNAMQNSLRPSPLRLAALKQRATTIYLCLPAARLATHYKWLRVIINLAMASFERQGVEAAKDGKPVLILLDEFAVLGYMQSIEKAAGQIAGFGVKLWTIIQDLGQLKAIYKDRWETFFGNAGITTWFGLNDATSLSYLSERLGKTYIVRKEATGVGLQAMGQGTAQFRDVYVETPLMAANEVERFFARQHKRMIVLVPGYLPYIVPRVDTRVHPFFMARLRV